MRITGVESTDLFTGSGGTSARAPQVVRVTVEATEAGEAGAAATIRIMGAGADTPHPFVMSLPQPGESRTCEVSVAVTGSPGTRLPVTVIAEPVLADGGPADGGAQRAELAASVVVAEPGWTMWMVSHFHYDPVWWNTQGQFTEARLVLPDEDGGLPDTRTAFDLVRLHLEKARRDADYKFVLAEIDYLKPHFDAFPADRAFLRSLLADGRAELVGGTYNEPNTNLTGAETTIRNAVYGMGFQRGVLAAEPASAWMLDAFGFDPGFPGLMAQAGLTSSSWARGPFHQWGPAENTRMQFPAEFEWLSPDGTGLLTAYMANHYGAGWTLHTAKDLPSALADAYTQFRQLAPVAATRNVMLPVGSDHVIPARWVTDVAREWSARYLWPRFVPAIPREFFAAVRAEAEAEPARFWIMPQTRDMNPVYTGKDVSYADTKLAARAGEVAVLEGERLATLAWLQGAPYPAESLDKAWRQLAYGAHHDAITGTESDEVYLDLLAGWREAWQRGDAARRDAIAFLAGAGPGQAGTAVTGAVGGAGDGDGGGNGDGDGGGAGLAVTVVNGLARERDGMATVTVRLPAPGTPWLTVIDPEAGDPVPALAEGVRRHPDGSLAEATLTFRARGVPPLGFRRYPLVAAAVPAGPAGPAADGWTDADGLAIENDAFLVTGAGGQGALASVFDKAAGRELLGGPGNDLVLQEEYQQHPRWNEGPWHLSPKGPGLASCAVPASVRAQRSPAGSRLVATYPLGDLSVTAETVLWDGSDRVEFRT
ncbi:MAG TPA: glycoside hydrolase, partial [Trebonia sp.]